MRQRRINIDLKGSDGDISQRNITLGDVSNTSGILHSSRIILSPLEHHLNQSMNQLEVEKRKSLAVQVQHSDIISKHQQYLNRLNKLKKYEASPQSIQWRTKVASMEGTLQKCIDTYNEHLSNNNKLRSAIDELRIAKKNMKKRDLDLRAKITKMADHLNNVKQDIENTIQRTNQNRQEIMQIAQTNSKQAKSISFNEPDKQSLKCQKPTIIPLNSAIVLKNQLHKQVTMNKQLHRYINVYQNQLICIHEQFQQIKEVENIRQLSEIQQNFIVAEERNESLNSYMNYLSKRSNKMEQYIAVLKDKINQSKKMLVEGGEQEHVEAETKSQTIIDGNSDELQDMLIDKIKQLQTLDISIEKDNNLPEEDTVEYMLSKVEKYLSRYLECKGKRQFRMGSAGKTNKSMVPPTAQSQTEEGRLLDVSQMVRYAEQQLQRHKGTKKLHTTKTLKNDSMLA